jgi:hypothetical protein
MKTCERENTRGSRTRSVLGQKLEVRERLLAGLGGHALNQGLLSRRKGAARDLIKKRLELVASGCNGGASRRESAKNR